MPVAGACCAPVTAFQLRPKRARNFFTRYPIDEAPAAYKDFKEVLRSVESAGLAMPVATLKVRFVIKDADKADD